MQLILINVHLCNKLFIYVKVVKYKYNLRKYKRGQKTEKKKNIKTFLCRG